MTRYRAGLGRWVKVEDNGTSVTMARIVFDASGKRVELERATYHRSLFNENANNCALPCCKEES